MMLAKKSGRRWRKPGTHSNAMAPIFFLCCVLVLYRHLAKQTLKVENEANDESFHQ